MHEITWGGKSEKTSPYLWSCAVLRSLTGWGNQADGFGHQSRVSVINPAAVFRVGMLFDSHLLCYDLTESRVNNPLLGRSIRIHY